MHKKDIFLQNNLLCRFYILHTLFHLLGGRTLNNLKQTHKNKRFAMHTYLQAAALTMIKLICTK